MPRSLLLPAALLALALSPLPAVAQGAKKGAVEMPDGKAVPENLFLRYPTPKSDGVPWLVWVAVGNYRPLRAARSDAATVPGVPLKFMEECYVAARHQGAGATFLLLVKSDPSKTKVDRVLGWIDERWVVPDPEAMYTVNGIYKKAVIVNTPETFKAGLQLFRLTGAAIGASLEAGMVPEAMTKELAKLGIKLAGKVTVLRGGDDRWSVVDEGLAAKPPRDGAVPQRFEVRFDAKGNQYVVADSFAQAGLYDAPRATAQRLTTLKLFNVLFVYAETGTGPGDFVLLGTQPTLRADAQVVKGWVPRRRLALWNTREGFEWDPETLRGASPRPLGAIFEFKDDADAWDDSKDVPAARRFFRERLDSKTKQPIRYAPADPRMLLLPSPRAGEGSGEQRPQTGNRLHWVGAAGELPGLSEDQQKKVKDNLQVVAQAEASLRVLELVFVIDDSQSMQKYFKEVAEAVEQVLLLARDEALKGGQDRTVKVAFSYYSDVPSKQPIRPSALKVVIKPKMTRAEMTAAITKLCDELKGHKFTFGDDDPEMVFDGLKAAIKEAEFSDFARKVVVLIGDMGDKSEEDGQTHKIKNTLVDALFPKGCGPIELYVIQMEERDRPNAARHKHAVMFEEQMKALAGLVNKRAGKDKLADFAHAADTKALRRHIADRYEQIRQRTRQWSGTLASIRAGELQTVVDDGLLLHLKAMGAEVEELRRVEGSQLFRQGYVWRRAPGNGARQLREVVLLSEADIRELCQLLRALVGPEARKIQSPKKLRELYIKEVENLTGESNLSLAEALAKKRGLSVESPLLKYKPTELTSLFKEKDLAPLRLKLRLLEDLLEDRYVEYVPVKKREEGGAEITEYEAKAGTKPVRRVRYYNLPGDSVRWYWVDVAREVP